MTGIILITCFIFQTNNKCTPIMRFVGFVYLNVALSVSLITIIHSISKSK